MSRIFLSHSHADSTAAVALHDWLREEGWDDVFLDLDPARGIAAGERWERALHAAAQRCEAVLFVVSKGWLGSPWCLKEFNLAHRLNKRLFGVLVEDIALAELPVHLTSTWQLVQLGAGRDHILRRVTMPVTGDEAHVTFSQEGLIRLRTGLRHAGLDPRFFDWPPEHDPDRPPYRGLRPLEAEDAGIFFGREAQIVEVLDRLRGLRDAAPPRLVVILGASGAGKSSFLRAGLLPRLARDDRDFLTLPVVRPERAAINGETGLVRALEEACRARNLGYPRAAIRDAVNGGVATLRPILTALVDAARPPEEPDAKPPLLVLPIDQSGSLFLAEGGDQATALLALLRELLIGDVPNILVLVTTRSESYERLQTASELHGIRQETLSLPPMLHGAFQAVIEGPATRLSDTARALEIDPALTEALMVDIEAGGSHDALPLLAFTLERLYLEYGASGRLALANYEALGRIRGSIEEAVERALAAADADPRIPRERPARLALLHHGLIPWLAGVDSETRAPRRRVARLSEIPEEARPLIDLLVEQRLLATDKMRDTGETIIEPAHEALLRQWGLLRSWLAEDFGALTRLEGIQRAARDWCANNRDAAWLAHMGGRLEEAERLNLRPDLAANLAPDDRDYLAACRAKADAERRSREEELAREAARLAEIAAAQARTARLQRHGRWTLAAVAVAVIIGIGLGVVQHRNNVTLQQSLAGERLALSTARANIMAELAAFEQLRGDPDGALRFALHGVQLDRGMPLPLPQAQLAAAVSGSQWRTVLVGHKGPVLSAAFSPDGKRIVTASADNTARVWDAATGNELAVLVGHSGAVNAAAFSPDGKRIVTASWDGTARLWDAATGKQLAILSRNGGFVMSVAFSPDGRRIVTGSVDQTARIWDAATGKELGVLRGHQFYVRDAVFSADGKRIVTASADQTARVWDAATGKEIAVMRSDDGGPFSAAFSPDGTRVVTASGNTAVIWDAATGKQLAVLRGHERDVASAVYSPDGTRIVTASTDKTARIWNAATGQEIAVLRGHEGAVNAAAFSPNGKLVVTASDDGTARIWDVAPDNRNIVLRGHDSFVSSAAFSPDGKRIVTASWDMTARIWDAAAGKQILVLRGHDDYVNSAAFSPDGKRIVTASHDRTARIWNAATGKQLVVLRGHGGDVKSAAFSPDGKRIVTASVDKTARIWDAATGRQLAVLSGHQDTVNSAAFSPGGRRVVTASDDRTAQVWDAATAKQILVLRGHLGSVAAAAFSPDGKLIVTAAADWTARIWLAATGTDIAVLRGHQWPVDDAAFSPDGRRIVTASFDKTARIWDTVTGNDIAVLSGHGSDVKTAAFSPDGTRVVTASDDRTARVWDVRIETMPMGGLIAEACQRRLSGISHFTRDEMRLAGYPDSHSPMNVCDGLGGGK